MTMYDELIEQLTTNLAPVSKYAVPRRLTIGVGAGTVASAMLLIVVLGVRPDIAAASSTGMFWVKFCYTLALAAFSVWIMERLARPAESARRRARWLWAPLLVLILLAAVEFARAPAPTYMSLVMGSGSALFCFSGITALAVPPLLGLIWAIRGLAPTNMRAAGLVAGLAAGGAGAFVYAWHCTESSAAFLAVWYSIGASAVAIFGWLLGPSLLRWR